MGTDGAASHIDYYEAATGTSNCRFLNTIFADASPLNKLVQGGAILNNVYNYSVIQDLDEYGLNEAQKLNNVEANFEDLFKGSEDYSLLETSPARDIGVADASERPLVGIIGTLRDSQPDAGAYEYAFEEVTVEGATPEGGFTTIFDSLAQSPAQNNGTLAPNDRDALDISNESFVMKFRIRNNGSANSKINDDIRVNISGTDASSFVVTRLPSITIPAQSYTEFEITFTPNKVGRSSATVTINTTDSDNTSYTFPIGGEASINGLTVIGNNNVIQNGSNNPKSSNNTDFGVLAAEYSQNTDSQGEPIGLPQFELADPEGKTLAYEIRNYSDEQITNISVRLEEQDGTNGFTLDTTDLPNFLDEGQGTTFYINLKPTDIEDYVANVTVTSNVDNKDPYTFLIIGTTLGDSDGGGNGSNTRSSGAGGGCSIAGDSSPAWYIPFATLALFMFGLRLRSNKE